MSKLDEAKQLLYLEENRAYRNAFKLDSMGATATKEENMSNTSPSIEIGVEYEIIHSVSLGEPITKESESIKHGTFAQAAKDGVTWDKVPEKDKYTFYLDKLDECCEDFNSRSERKIISEWNGA